MEKRVVIEKKDGVSSKQVKRFRPTLGAYRALEQKLKDAAAELSVATDTLTKVRAELVSLRDSYATCEKSNKLMEDELVLRDDKIRLLEEIADNRAAEVERLKRRGFWARVFNR